MKAGAKGRAGKAPAPVRRGRPQNDAEEAMNDAEAELNDTTAALNGGGESAPPALPDGLLQRRLDKEKQDKAVVTADKEKLIKEKELLQKEMDEMKAQLALAKANVGDVVSVTTPARKVCWKAYLIDRIRQINVIKADASFPQRQKSMASAVPFAVSAILPATGGLTEVLTGNGQTYIRDLQKEVVPRMIAVAGYRWHNSVNRETLIQILQYLTIRRGGVYTHWDTLQARSTRLNGAAVLANQFAKSHAHAAGSHQALVRTAVAKLFQDTPNDKKLNFVKEEVFGITDGRPIIGPDHPVVVEMMAQPIVGTLYFCMFHIVVRSAIF